MFYGTKISNEPFLEFSGFRVRHFKDGGHQYKCHKYLKNYVTLSSNVDDIG